MKRALPLVALLASTRPAMNGAVSDLSHPARILKKAALMKRAAIIPTITISALLLACPAAKAGEAMDALMSCNKTRAQKYARSNPQETANGIAQAVYTLCEKERRAAMREQGFDPDTLASRTKQDDIEMIAAYVMRFRAGE
jgi:hypothetical protein